MPCVIWGVSPRVRVTQRYGIRTSAARGIQYTMAVICNGKIDRMIANYDRAYCHAVSSIIRVREPMPSTSSCLSATCCSLTIGTQRRRAGSDIVDCCATAAVNGRRALLTTSFPITTRYVVIIFGSAPKRSSDRPSVSAIITPSSDTGDTHSDVCLS